MKRVITVLLFSIFSIAAFGQDYKSELRDFESVGDFMHGYKTWGVVTDISTDDRDAQEMVALMFGGDCILKLKAYFSSGYYSLTIGATAYTKNRKPYAERTVGVGSYSVDVDGDDLIVDADHDDIWDDGYVRMTRYDDKIIATFSYTISYYGEHTDSLTCEFLKDK